jgi:hypothetical protein
LDNSKELNRAMTPPRDSERLDLPSASSFESDVLCPGRRQLLASLPPTAFKQSDDDEASRGTRIHKARETGNTLELDEEDLEIYDRGLATEKAALAQWQLDFHIEQCHEGPGEERLFLNWPDTLQPATSARLDVHYCAAGRVLVVEWKSLWCSNLTAAERNWQGRLQAVLIAREYDAKHVRVVFNKAMFGKTDVVDYGETDLAFAEKSIFQHLWETQQDEAQRRPGPWCRYCPAKPYCPEAGAMAMLPAVMSGITRGPEGLDVTRYVAQLAPLDLKAIFERSAIIGKILDAVKGRLKSFTDEELAALKIGRKPGRKLDPIVDTKGLWDKLVSEGVTPDELWPALSWSKGDLLKALQRDKGWAAGPAKGWRDQIIEPFIEKKSAEASLERIE